MKALRAWFGRVMLLARGLPKGASAPPLPYEWFSDDEAACYHRAVLGAEALAVDEATARDLHLADYVRQLASDRSIFARQYLLHRLLAGAGGTAGAAEAEAERQATRERVQLLQASARAAAAVQGAVAGLRTVPAEVASFVFGQDGVVLPPAFARIRSFEALVLALGLAVLVWPGAWTATLLAACLVFGLGFQMRWYRVLQQWTRQRDGVLAMLRAARVLAAAHEALPPPLRPGVLATPACIDRLLATLRPGPLARVPALAEYLNLLLLHEYASAARDGLAMARERVALGAVFEAVARSEAELALATMATACTGGGTAWCWATPAPPGQLAVQGLQHPLLARPIGVDVAVAPGRGLFISGRNGEGKSTLMRALGLAVLTARAFGHAHAQRASLPRVMVCTSIQVHDDIGQGRSLYLAELARAAALCRVAAQRQAVLFIADELFRGTNYVESVAACAATVRALAQGGMVVVASHNVVLATLLAPWLDALRLQRSPGAPPALQLVPGVLVDTNGVAVLRSEGFDAELVARAERIQAWYAAYVTHPTQLPGDLMA
ncbi:MutS-related protein [Aquabacterium sp. OR-4]|uniref:MutS-related protein n=1 Tax=Aquabacterium sp. OR-4 TaxID=2978127 RepID=UPI0021B27AFE|nr:hypothetical protein [Aquabacterium sp. OR-4]MDT7838227.1 hypothetical protein [Aquabacterium sp. OR-4]